MLKFKSKDQKIFFTGCTHFNHDKDFIYKNRGFNSYLEALEGQIEIWNQTVDNDSIIFSLGDFIFNDPKGELCYKVLNRLNCKYHYLIFGNHNSGIKQVFKESDQILNNCLLGHYAEIFIDNIPICLFHYPIASWNSMSLGSYMLSSHTHGNYQLSRPEDKTAKLLDCGWDMFKKPVEFSEIRAIMDTKGLQKLDHHV